MEIKSTENFSISLWPLVALGSFYIFNIIYLFLSTFINFYLAWKYRRPKEKMRKRGREENLLPFGSFPKWSQQSGQTQAAVSIQNSILVHVLHRVLAAQVLPGSISRKQQLKWKYWLELGTLIWEQGTSSGNLMHSSSTSTIFSKFHLVFWNFKGIVC